MSNILKITFILFVHSAAFAKTHSTIKISAIKSSGSQATLAFKTVPNGDLVINEEGPWTLKINRATQVTFDSKIYKKEAYQSNVPGFKTEIKYNKKPKEFVIDYKMVVFVCTKDKSMCFRDVHKITDKTIKL